MGGNYEKGIYNQLMDVMARLDTLENDLRMGKQEHKDDVNRLNSQVNNPAASNGASSKIRCRAAGYVTLAAVAKCEQARTWLVASQESMP